MNKDLKCLLVQTDSRQKVLEVLQNYSTPLTISQISRISKMNWSTVRNILTELVLTGRVEGFRIGRVLGFKLNTSASQSHKAVT